MKKNVNKDNGKGGTSNENNREYGGIVRNGTVKESPAGEVGNPQSNTNVSIEHPDVKPGDILFHSHPSGQVVVQENAGANVVKSSSTSITYSWQAAPSKHDVNNTSGIGYVFARSNKTVYVYNSSGVLATIPQKRFVTPKKSR